MKSPALGGLYEEKPVHVKMREGEGHVRNFCPLSLSGEVKYAATMT